MEREDLARSRSRNAPLSLAVPPPPPRDSCNPTINYFRMARCNTIHARATESRLRFAGFVWRICFGGVDIARHPASLIRNDNSRSSTPSPPREPSRIIAICHTCEVPRLSARIHPCVRVTRIYTTETDNRVNMRVHGYVRSTWIIHCVSSALRLKLQQHNPDIPMSVRARVSGLTLEMPCQSRCMFKYRVSLS